MSEPNDRPPDPAIQPPSVERVPSARLSSTALGVAWLHAAHQAIDAPPRLLEDPIIIPLLGATPDDFARFADRTQTLGARALRAHLALRTRFAEDRLAAAVRKGVRQYIVLGAGMDTFAYRQPEWARVLRIWEVDQEGTQWIKLHRLTASGFPKPKNLTYIAVDFEVEPLRDAFARGGVRLDQPAVFAWLGVTMYLTLPAIDAVFDLVASMPRGTEIVFTFASRAHAGEQADGPDGGSALARNAAAVGEPWITFFESDVLEHTLRQHGFSRVEFLSPRDAAERYFRGLGTPLPPPRTASIVSATV